MSIVRYPVEDGRICIDLNLHSFNQLFDSLDPSPFLERDLDRNAVEYIVSATREHPLRSPILIRVHVSGNESPAPDKQVLIDAFHNHFAYSVELMRKKNKLILRQGRLNLVMALGLLLGCLVFAQWIDQRAPQTFLGRAFREGLIILGWVAMWRPIDVFLYSWLPQFEMKRVYAKLSVAPVKIVQK